MKSNNFRMSSKRVSNSSNKQKSSSHMFTATHNLKFSSQTFNKAEMFLHKDEIEIEDKHQNSS